MVERRTLLILAGITIAALISMQSGLFALVGNTTESMESCDFNRDANTYTASCSGIGNFRDAPITFTAPEDSFSGAANKQAGSWRQQWVSDYLVERTELNRDDFTTQCIDSFGAGRSVTICTYTAEQRDIVKNELSVSNIIVNNPDREDWSGTKYALIVGVDQKIADIVERGGTCTATINDRDTGESFTVDGVFRLGGNGLLCGVDPNKTVEMDKSPSVSWTITPDFRVDSDGDGVPDEEDSCPNQPGEGSDGCPVSSTPQPDQPETQPVGVIGQLQAFLQGVVDAVRGVFMR